MVMLNVTEEAANRLRAYAEAHGLDESGALDALVPPNDLEVSPEARARGEAYLAFLERFRREVDLEELDMDEFVASARKLRELPAR